MAFGEPTHGLAVDGESFELPSGNLVARFSTTILETPKHEKLLGRVAVTLAAMKALPRQDRKTRPVGVYAGRLVPIVVQPTPVTLSSIASDLLQATTTAPLKGPTAMVRANGPVDAMKAAIEYLVKQSLPQGRDGES